MRRTIRRKPSKLALTLSLFFLGSFASSAHLDRRSWRPDSELPGAPFVLGDGKNQGSKVKGYEGEWPLWSSFRTINSAQVAGSSTAPAASSSVSSNATMHVCAPIGECEPCPDDVIHLPYCRPYNNRRRVACSPVSDANNTTAIQAALRSATTASNPAALLGYEACGKSAKHEARDYFEMIVSHPSPPFNFASIAQRMLTRICCRADAKQAVIASIAIFSVWAFVQRQKLLFRRQNLQLQSRVTGASRTSRMPQPMSPAKARAVKGHRKMRSARLAGGSISR